MDHFVLLARMSDVIAARITAARLRSEGIDVRLKGESLGPYRLTVGAMAVTELWVSQSSLERARRVMLEAEVDEVLGSAGRETRRRPDPSWVVPAIATAMLVVVLLRLVWAVL